MTIDVKWRIENKMEKRKSFNQRKSPNVKQRIKMALSKAKTKPDKQNDKKMTAQA